MRRAFIETLARMKHDLFAASHLHDDGTLQNVDARMGVVTLTVHAGVRGKLNCEPRPLFSSRLRQIFRQQRRHFGLLSNKCANHHKSGYD